MSRNKILSKYDIEELDKIAYRFRTTVDKTEKDGDIKFLMSIIEHFYTESKEEHKNENSSNK